MTYLMDKLDIVMMFIQNKIYICVKFENDLQVELLEPEPCYDLSYGHDVGILLPHTGEHHQGQLDVECTQALKKLIPTLGSRFDSLTINRFSTLLP
jgi:hypothetical protein